MGGIFMGSTFTAEALVLLGFNTLCGAGAVFARLAFGGYYHY